MPRLVVKLWWHRDLQNTTAFSGATVDHRLHTLPTKHPELDIHSAEGSG